MPERATQSQTARESHRYDELSGVSGCSFHILGARRLLFGAVGAARESFTAAAQVDRVPDVTAEHTKLFVSSWLEQRPSNLRDLHLRARTNLLDIFEDVEVTVAAETRHLSAIASGAPLSWYVKGRVKNAWRIHKDCRNDLLWEDCYHGCNMAMLYLSSVHNKL